MIWIRVYGGKNKDVADAIFNSLKINFPYAPLTMSAADGQLIKINMHGEFDERPLCAHASAIDKFWNKTYKDWKKKNEDPVPST